MEPTSSWILVRFIASGPQWELRAFSFPALGAAPCLSSSSTVQPEKGRREMGKERTVFEGRGWEVLGLPQLHPLCPRALGQAR